ncbi:MAG: BTAD domain-containing putative transcriptional regulator [Candidatus Limnocylindrales bacterium]
MDSGVLAEARLEGTPPGGGADFRLLGPVEVTVGGRAIALGGAKQRALLALLVLHANEVVSRDFLIDELWGERAPEQAAHSIVVYVSRLRKALHVPGAGATSMLGSEAGGYVLRAAPEQIDVERFERALEQGGRALAEGAASDAADILRRACAEWRGEPLSDLVAAPFAEGASWRLAELRLAAVESRIDADLAVGRHAELVGELESLVRGNPLNERLAAQLMVALYRSGRQARALEVYRTTRRSLVDELGIEPSEDLQRLERAILRHDPDLEAPVIRPAARAALPSPAHEPVGPARKQRKTISVLVARVAPVGQAERADPEALRLAMARCSRAVRASIERHGGTAERLLGDATLGVFGVPVVHEDDALRAVRAAAEMRDAVGALSAVLARERGVTFELRLGVDTGLALTGTAESPVVGKVLSVAAELEQVAQAGEILLGAETVRLLAPVLEAEPRPPVAVRGESKPVTAFRLQQLAADAQDIGRPPLDLVFVGRAAELKALRAAFDQAVAERGPQLVTVVGEPGIGKTRLLAEIAAELAGEARVLGGRCLPYGDGITYWPLVGLLRGLGGPDALAELLAFDDQGGQVRELLLGAVGVADQAGSVEEVQWAVRRLFEALGRDRPLVVVLDDLHWAEPAFLQLVEYLASCSRGAPILLLGAARDELLETRPAWALPRPGALILPLRALSEPEAQALIDQAIAGPGLSGPRRAQIAGAAAGNPLFLEQLLAHETGGGEPAEELALPPTIEALLAARLDRLPTAERDLLERAAVEGVVFHRGAVTALLPPDERAEVGAHLLSAIRRNLVRPQPADLPGEDGFRFVHGLVHDAVYGSIPKELRAELHERFAAWLEGRGDARLEPDEVLGYHLEQAALYRRELGLPDDGLAVRAGERLAIAGRRAMWRGDTAASASLLGRALELTRPIRFDLHLEVDFCYGIDWTDPKRGAAIAKAAAERAQALGDKPGEALARVVCAEFSIFAGDGGVDELEALARAALPLLEEVGDQAGLARVWYALGFRVAQDRGRFEDMAEACEQVFRRAGFGGQRPGDAGGPDDVAWGTAGASGVFASLAFALADGPRPAAEVLGELDALLRGRPNPRLLLWRAYVLAMLDQADEAAPSPGRLCELSREVGAFPGEAIAAAIATIQGDHETAAAYLRIMCAELEERGQPGFLSTFSPTLGRSLCALGRYSEAEPCARIGHDLGDESDVLTQTLWRQVQAIVDAHRGETEEAERLAREAVTLSEQTDSPTYQAQALCDLAEVLRCAGREPEAADALAQALDRYERKGNVAMARQVRGLLAVEHVATG